MNILGFESSCDETAVAVVNVKKYGEGYVGEVISSQVYSQYAEHAEYGGVVPEIAARAHLERLQPLTNAALKQANLSMDNIDGIAATSGPGLLGGVLMGLTFAKSLALATGKPFIGVNHLEGHALTAQLTEKIDFPYLLLLASGGHCQFIQVNNLGEYKTLGGTLDDAIGECFDKVARMLHLPHPGGPNVEKRAQNGDKNAYKFTIPMNDKSVNFSFSGLKTAVRNQIIDEGDKNLSKLNDDTINNICASFQETVAKTLEKKCANALAQTNAKQFVLAGGVAANKLLRERLEALCNTNGCNFHAPPMNLCTDNAVMIAYAGGLHMLNGVTSKLDISAKPRWPLEQVTNM